jgi:soluble lytic murein transglycosylase-like protein
MSTLTGLFVTISLQFGLPPGLLSSLCFIESAHKVNAVNRDDGHGDSIGVCQIKLKTARYLGFKGSEKDLFLPKNNVYYAAKYLAKQRRRYSGSITKAVISYNIGHAGKLTSSKYQVKVYKHWEAKK